MSDFVELRRIFIAVARRWWLLVLVAGVVASIGYVASKRQTPVYEASVTILVGQFLQATELNRGDIEATQVLAQTYADMARRQPVLQSVTENLNLSDRWTALKKRVRVRLVEGTQLLQIRVEASAPEEARVTADEIASQLILLSPTALQADEQDENLVFVSNRLESLRTKIDSGQEQLEALEAREAEMAGLLPVGQLNELRKEINTLEGLIAGWENSYSQFLTYLKGEQSPNHLAVIEPAHANFSPTRPRPMLSTIVAGMVGLALAAGLVFLLEFLDDTLKTADELSHSLGLTTLGTIQYGKTLDHAYGPVSIKDPSSRVAEAYRVIRSNIQFLSADQPVTSILVTSPTYREGKSVTVANLGVVMAQAGLRTIVIDANLRQPVLHQMFNVTNAAGLVDLLRSSEFAIEGLLRKTNLEHLQVLTSGGLVDNPSDLLSSERMDELLDNLAELADVVIFDSFPVLDATDAAVLANQADGVVFVTQAGRTLLGDAELAITKLRQANAEILGAVLNQFPKRRLDFSRITSRFASDPVRRNRTQRRWLWLPF
jgi:capsular exopolysaccharide synthesis family protein